MKGEPVLSLTTPDPRFDPAKALRVNGYLFVPADPRTRAAPPAKPDRMKPDHALRRIGAYV